MDACDKQRGRSLMQEQLKRGIAQENFWENGVQAVKKNYNSIDV